jgi:hypothetical protein
VFDFYMFLFGKITHQTQADTSRNTGGKAGGIALPESLQAVVFSRCKIESSS